MKKYRVVMIINMDKQHITEVANPAEGETVIKALANYLLTFPESMVWASSFDFQVLDEESMEWGTWADSQGFELRDYETGELVTVEELKQTCYTERGRLL